MINIDSTHLKQNLMMGNASKLKPLQAQLPNTPQFLQIYIREERIQRAVCDKQTLLLPTSNPRTLMVNFPYLKNIFTPEELNYTNVENTLSTTLLVIFKMIIMSYT